MKKAKYQKPPPKKNPVKAISAKAAVNWSTRARCPVQSAIHPHRFGPMIRMACISDISMPISNASIPLNARYRVTYVGKTPTKL